MSKELDNNLFHIEIVKEDQKNSFPKSVEGCATCHTCGGPCSCHSEYDAIEPIVNKKDEDQLTDVNTPTNKP